MAKYGVLKETEQDEEIQPLDFVPESLKKQIPTLSEEEKQELYAGSEARTDSKDLYIQKGQEVIIKNASKYNKSEAFAEQGERLGPDSASTKMNGEATVSSTSVDDNPDNWIDSNYDA